MDHVALAKRLASVEDHLQRLLEHLDDASARGARIPGHIRRLHRPEVRRRQEPIAGMIQSTGRIHSAGMIRSAGMTHAAGMMHLGGHDALGGH